jgi:hypothetical protein
LAEAFRAELDRGMALADYAVAKSLMAERRIPKAEYLDPGLRLISN